MERTERQKKLLVENIKQLPNTTTGVGGYYLTDYKQCEIDGSYHTTKLYLYRDIIYSNTIYLVIRDQAMSTIYKIVNNGLTEKEMAVRGNILLLREIAREQGNLDLSTIDTILSIVDSILGIRR